MNDPRAQALRLSYDDIMDMRKDASPYLSLDECTREEDCECARCNEEHRITLAKLAAWCVCAAFSWVLIIESFRWCLAYTAVR